MARWLTHCLVLGTLLLGTLSLSSILSAEDPAQEILSLIPDQTGVVVLIADSDTTKPNSAESLIETVKQLSEARPLTIYVQSPDAVLVHRLRRAAEQLGLLGDRVFVEHSTSDRIRLSENLADALYVSENLENPPAEQEILRVLRPHGKALVAGRSVTKGMPPGMDDWSHPFHGPDNNPQSNDQWVKGDFQTQFIGYPQFSPMPEQTVVAGGRIYKAMGHIAHKANQNEMLNTLACINAYNGSILWRRPLSEGFMIHRNTMIATPDALYMGDHESCKVIDAITGQVRLELTVDPALTDGPVWKWMAMEGDTLFAMVGNPEVEISTVRSDRPGIGHWPWGMWDGHDYSDPRTAFGHGRTLVALNRHTGQLLWSYRDSDFLDARGICMKGDRIFAYCPERFLACIDARNGQVLWKNSDRDLLEAIGPHERAQHYVTGYATTTYLKCTEDHLFFAGPQRQRLVVASTHDGRLRWTNEVGNLQLVLRPEAIYAAGPERTRGMLLDYETGKELASLPARRACTRATGCADSIFFRASGGTVRIMAATQQTSVSARHIAPMRPPCQDGVIVSNGHLYWGPWMCGCQLSFYGNIGLRPVGDHVLQPRDVNQATRDGLTVFDSSSTLAPLEALPGDWTTYQATNDRSQRTAALIPEQVTVAWSSPISRSQLPTAPVTAGGMVFVGDRSGAIRAYHRDGSQAWITYTGGPVYFPPCIAHDRVFAGSADGKVYALEAASGRILWTYQLAPQNDRIPIFGKLVSRWPVAGGVVVDGNRVYAAAGLTHYDGTFVAALDAASGQPLAINDTSGILSEHVESGISMQGELYIADNELRFAGGGIYETARYRLDDLTCLNEPLHDITSQYRTAFSAWYPEYNRYVSLEAALADGRVVAFDANYDGSEFSSLSLEPPRPLGMHGKMQKDLAGEFLRRRGKEAPPAILWQDPRQLRFTALALSDTTLIGAAQAPLENNQAVLVAIDVQSGNQLWQQPLPAATVKGGLAVDSAGGIYLTLEDGSLIAFKPSID
jgi:outer membrane protein assembly factor BamB